MKPFLKLPDMSANRFPMLRFLKVICLLGLPLMLAPSAFAFVTGGPINEAYQVPVIGFGLPGDLTAPKNIGEEYRRNTPVMYYAFDQNFLEFFGSNGVAAVDQAYTILNTVSNLTQFSSDLSEFPLESRRRNYSAEALSLLDLRSVTLGAMTEQLGLDQPVRYVWNIHNRFLPTGNPPCPAGEVYTIVQRNLPLIPSPLNQPEYSSYVNGTLYSYVIEEFCTGPNPLADAVEFSVDPTADQFSAVADYFSEWYSGLTVGSFYTYLTRDDVGGLRYLMATNNYNIESAGPGTVQFVTNNSPQFLITQDLGLLAAEAPTNSALQLEALFPGLIVNDVSNYPAVVLTTNISLVVTSAPFAPAGFLQVKIVTNITPSIVQFYVHTFDNIITNTFTTQTVIQEITPSTSPFAPAGSPPTSTKVKTIKVTQTAGDFFIIPTGLCSIQILNSNLLTTVIATTNTIFSTNIVTTVTNATGGTVSNSTLSVSIVTYFTNHAIVYLPITCPADTVDLRGGIGGIEFVRRDFDSLFGRFWAPATNIYTITSLTNNVLVPQAFERTVDQPDFLFTAQDLDAGPATVATAATFARNVNFNQANALTGLAGPGTIESPTTFIFNKSTPIYVNLPTGAGHGFFLTELTQAPVLIFASFDASTNAPVIYPDGTSLQNLMNMLVIRVSPSAGALPDGSVGVGYSVTLTVNGGQAPYTWSLSPASPGGFPPGLGWDGDPSATSSSDGIISGTPAASGTYDFIIRLTDAGSRFVDVPYSITINP
jgi:hypothetical protein